MLECRHCHRFFRESPENLGARCPSCRLPLFERAEKAFPPLGEGMKACSTHPTRPAVGVCKRCGNQLCPVCRTRWQEQLVCPACIERALTAPDTEALKARGHRRLAAWSLALGISGWLLLALGLLPLFLLARPSRELVVLVFIVVLLSLVPALFAAGQGTAAVRARGDRLRMATAGLCLGGAQVGVLLGFLMLILWAN